MPGEHLAGRMDPAVDPPEEWSTQEVEAAEAERLRGLAMMALAASTHPARTADADRVVRAIDKRVSRRAAQAFLVCLRFYAPGNPYDWNELQAQASADPEARRRGAQVVWEEWIPAHLIWLHQRAAHLAAWAVKDEELEWGNAMVFRLDREAELLTRAAIVP